MQFSLAEDASPHLCGKNKVFFTLSVLIFLVALYLRASGLFRGLGEHGYIFHPDEAKQILALSNFLSGDYVRYYGSLFYDGYPYGLNHLDEYLLRPFLFFLDPDTPAQHTLYYYARLLRLAYSMAIMAITYQLVYRLVRDRITVLLALLLIGLSPLSITVTHFATGDIGVDLFCAICFLFVLFYLDKKHKKTWLYCSGIAVGAAFSAKYNGLLVGMVPAMVLGFEFLQEKQLQFLAERCCVLVAGTVLGVFLFTPNLLLDFSTTLANMVANFSFIKNYNVPADILAKPWPEKAFLGLRTNSFSIVASLGYVVCFSSLLGLLITGKKYLTELHSPDKQRHSHTIFLLSVTLFPIFSFIIALSGKYVVQPFHFSYLLLPLILVTCYLFSTLRSSSNILLRGCSILLIVFAVVEFGRVSLQENFFWRLEDSLYIEQNLPASIYNKKSFYTHHSGKIRSLLLESSNHSIFRNRKLEAKGPDSDFWNTIEVAPLPQVPNQIGKNWLFLNGPSFPRNERMLFVQGESKGNTIKRYLVQPSNKNIPYFGLRCGSYATEATITFGQASTVVKLDAHQQKTVFLEPKEWRVSGGKKAGEKNLRIIPLEISVPHNDIWLTILTSQKERKIFNLFGGGQEEPPCVPEKLPAKLEQEYFSALSRIRYLESSPSRRVTGAKRIPIWEVAVPAGRYKLTCIVDGLEDESAITIELEDAKGELHRGQKESFQIRKGLQRIEYIFAKPFVPYQGRFIISDVIGDCRFLSLKLSPDYKKISDDFVAWRTNGTIPNWVSRFGKVSAN